VSRGPVPRAAGRIAAGPRPGWLRRFWRELGSVVPEHDTVVRLIAVERLAKSAVLVVGAVSLLTADRLGYLTRWAQAVQDELELSQDRGVITRVLSWIADQLGHLLPHVTVVALALILYAALEATEGVGLAMRRRWAEYLTVVATGLLIPFEVTEVVARPTLVRVGALLVNAAVVVYLAYRKRLFVGV
jgi:uncharacterized membrane protein (DUF2068 family)